MGQMYESHYMRRKLEALVERIRFIHNTELEGNPKLRSTTKFGTSKNNVTMKGDCLLTEDVFYKVLQDPAVNAIFEDLDLRVDHRLNSFQFFDISNDGRVSLAELIQTLMKMRGETNKSDLVASWALLEDFRNQFNEFQKTAMAHQKSAMANIKALNQSPSQNGTESRRGIPDRPWQQFRSDE